MVSTRITFSNRRRLMARWFLIGFLVRLALAIVITLLMAWNWEAVMLYLADFPTILCLDLVESVLPSSVAKQLSGNHPFYVPMNILGALIWGFLFMLASLAFSLIKSRKPLLSGSKESKGAYQTRA